MTTEIFQQPARAGSRKSGNRFSEKDHAQTKGQATGL